MLNKILFILKASLAVCSFSLCMYLTLTVKAIDSFDFEDFRENLTATHVINNRFVDYNKVEVKVEKPKPEIAINKHHDKKSDDYLGSIEIPVINVSDSIYRSEGDYYLNHDFNKKSYEPGELYLDDRTGNSLFGTGALLNGHAMPDGTKFGNFKKLLDVEEQPEIKVWDEALQEVKIYKMLFVSLIDGGTSGIIMDFPNEERRLQYYKNLYSTSIKQWEEPSEGDTFMLLNSCAYIIRDGHYVVVAKQEVQDER